MKALILYDGSLLSQHLLKTACQDACQLQTPNPDPARAIQTEALVLVFECLDHKEAVSSLEAHQQACQLARHSVDRLERCGEFDKIEGEIVRSCTRDLTNAIIERAQQYKADAIYLATNTTGQAGQVAVVRSAGVWRRWLGIKPTPDEVAVRPVAAASYPALTSAQVEIKQLIKYARVVLVNHEGLAMRIRYVKPQKAASSLKATGTPGNGQNVA